MKRTRFAALVSIFLNALVYLFLIDDKCAMRYNLECHAPGYVTELVVNTIGIDIGHGHGADKGDAQNGSFRPLDISNRDPLCAAVQADYENRIAHQLKVLFSIPQLTDKARRLLAGRRTRHDCLSENPA